MIKYIELQIWDWVNHKSLGSQQVSFLDAYGDIGVGIADDNLYLEDDLDPIPLTEELLILNGFMYIEYRDCWIYKDKRGDYLPFRIHVKRKPNGKFKGFEISFMDSPLEYVHQLQSVLRACGHSDIANNFKVEQNNIDLITQ